MRATDLQSQKSVLLVSDCNIQSIQNLLNKYQLHLVISQDNLKIPGSYWGDSEAGLIADTIYARKDTPIHSLLHETCHYICMDKQRRDQIHTNAEGDYDEENGVCYLQIILADSIPEMGRERMMSDMDIWGYTFRLGSAQNWFEKDAEDAFNWLLRHKIINLDGKCRFSLRKL